MMQQCSLQWCQLMTQLIFAGHRSAAVFTPVVPASWLELALPSSFDVHSGQPQWARMHSTDGPVPSPVTRIRNQLTTMPWHRDQNMKVLRPWSLVVDGKDPPCIRDTIRDVQRHMGASTWVKDDRKSVKITSRQRWTHVISGRLGDGDLAERGPGAWSWTERIPRAYETLSETFRDTWVQVHG